MNEKELIVNLVHTDDDAHYIFNIFKDNHKKGKIGFKRMRIRNLLSSKSQIDELLTAVKELTPVRELEVLLQDFTNSNSTLTHLQQYLLIKSCFPAFVADNYEMVLHNIKEKRAPFTGLTPYKTLEEAEAFYFGRYEELNLQTMENLNQEAIRLFEAELGGRKRYESVLQGANLMDLDRLLGYAGTDSDLDFNIRQQFFPDNEETVVDSSIVELEKVCQKELTKLGLYSTFLEVGQYPEAVRIKLLQEIQRSFFVFNLQRQGLTSAYHYLDMKEQWDDTQQKQQGLQKDLKKATARIVELEQRNQQVEIDALKKVIEEQKALLSEGEVVREATKEEWDRLAQVSRNETVHLKTQLQKYEEMAGGYKWMLASDFSVHDIVVVYNSPLLYAKHIYHELVFMDLNRALKEPFKSKIVLVQLVGMTGKQKKQMEKLAQKQEMELIFLESVDERDLIMDIACYLKESEEVQHESA